MSEKTFFILWFAAIGALFGSFINAMAYRTIHKVSPVKTSRCEHCGQAIKPWDEIPIVSWFVLRGRCRHCKSRISASMLISEIGMAALYASGIFLFYRDVWALSIFLVFVTIAGYLAMTALKIMGNLSQKTGV